MSAVAWLIVALFQNRSLASVALSNASLGLQCLAGLGFGGLVALASYVTFRLTAGRGATRKTIDSYSRLDLSGLNPVWFSVAAGIWEELLFRAALQPLLGIWFASLLFVLVHAPAYQVRQINRATLVQAAGVFGMSVMLGLMFEYVGLVAAMLVHAVVDIVGLYAVRGAYRDCRQGE